MRRVLGFLYGIAVYIFFFAVFLYLLAFLGNITEFFGQSLPVPKTIDGPGRFTGPWAYLVNLGLLALFGIQHTVMARHGFKIKMRSKIGERMERPTYILVTSLLLVLLFWQWRPLPEAVWALEGFAGTLMAVIFWGGWALVLVTTFLIDHFELFGLKHALYQLQNKPLPKYKFVTPLFYKLCRHPLYLGWIMAFWGAPVMSRGHLLLSVVWTVYIFIAIPYEEKDLTKAFGKKYRDYATKTPMIVPFLKLKK